MTFFVAGRMNRTAATRTAEAFRKEFGEAAVDWSLHATATIGVATRDSETAGVYQRPTMLQAAAAQALKAGMSTGGDCVKFFTPKKAA